MKKIVFLLFLIGLSGILSLSARNEALLTNHDIVVAQDSSGDYLTVQEAIDAAPDNDTSETIIFIKKGIYKEKILVGSSKTHLTLLGEDVDSTILTYDDYSGRVVNGNTLGTSGSYSFQVDADYFKAQYLTFENSAVQEAQAVALLMNGDKNILYHCKLLGNQDTYYTKGYGRIYVKDCYIEGTTDFIFGRACVVFDSCLIHSKKISYITAASTEQEYAFGYVFFDCQLTAAQSIFNVFLGRPWRPYARTVFIRTYMDRHIAPSGWSEWNGNTNHTTCFYAEYDCVGPRAVRTFRKPWSYELTATEAMDYTIPTIFAKTTAPTIYSEDWIPALDSLPYIPYVNFPPSTGIEELKAQFNLQVYPNPVKEVVEFTFSLEKAETVSLKLFDANGKLLRELPQHRLGAGKQRLDVSLQELPGGAYFYHLQIGGQLLSGSLVRD